MDLDLPYILYNNIMNSILDKVYNHSQTSASSIENGTGQVGMLGFYLFSSMVVILINHPSYPILTFLATKTGSILLKSEVLLTKLTHSRDIMFYKA